MVDHETKVISAILFATFLSLVGAYYFDRQYFVDWADVEKIAEYDSEVIIGDTIQISYYLVNPKSHDVKVEPRLSHGLSTYYESNPDERITTNVNVHPLYKFITVPAKSKLQVFAETVTATQLGTLHVKVTGLPEVQIDVLEPVTSEDEFNVVIELNKYVFGSKFTAKLIIKNEDSHEITYGRPYFIEKLVEGGWVEVSSIPPNWAWTDERLIIPAGWKTTQVIKVDTLEHGHYRVNKTINLERTQTELAFTLEFDVVGLTTYDNVTLEDEEQLIEIIKVAYDLREFLNSGRLQHVAASPSERDIVNATILLGEIVEGKNAEMIMGYEVGDSMTSYVRYFTVKRYNLRGSPSRLIGERHGWIDQLGRCHVYDGWAELRTE